MGATLSTVRRYEDGEINTACNGRIGRYAFFPRLIEEHYGKSLPSKLTIMDIGCGAAADHPLLLDYFTKKGVRLNLIGVDVNPDVLNLTKEGRLTLPLEVDLELDERGKPAISKGMGSYRDRKRAVLPRRVQDFYESVSGADQSYTHIDLSISKESGRWVMRPEWRRRLHLVRADAVSLPFPNNIADIVIAENFSFHSSEGIWGRIYKDVMRVLKPNRKLLGDW